MAAAALGMRGEEAKGVIPVLMEAAKRPSLILSSHAEAALTRLRSGASDSFLTALTNSARATNAIKAASVLYALGTNADWIAARLTNAFDRSVSDQFEVLELICRNELEPAVAWPIIAFGLEKKCAFRANAVNAAIIQLGSHTCSPKWDARAHSALVACLRDSDVMVRKNAVFALSICYPQDEKLIPPGILATLITDRDADIRIWAESLQKRSAAPQ